MSGSTLYRRLPNGTWAVEREDPPQAQAPAAPGPAGPPPAAPLVVDAPRGTAVGGMVSSGPPTGQPPPAAPPPPMSASPRPPGPPRRRRRRVLWLVGIALLACVVWIVGLTAHMATSLSTVDARSPDPVADTSGSVWLLVGSDSREGLTPQQQSQLHTGGDVGQRTDTIMLVRMAAGSAPTLISIPRDSWVAIPAHTASDGTHVGLRYDKINAAYAYGGAPLLTQTIEYNTGLHVDHFVEVGFSGIVSLTQAVGGVPACFDRAIDDRNSGLKVSAGCHVLDGPQSLAYVRMRYSDPKGDLGRIERQQHYVSAVIHKVLSWQTAVNPLRQLAIADAASAAVTVDQSTGPVDLARFGLGMGKIASGSGDVTVVPVDESDHWEGDQWVIHWDPEKARALFSSLGARTPQSG